MDDAPLTGDPELDKRIEPEPNSSCWVWVGWRRSRLGYGGIYRNGRTSDAHRYVYERLIGPIPHGLQIDHLCRVPACVNPAHLEPVTMQENVRRGYGFSAMNARKTHCPRGHPFNETNTRVGKTGSRFCRLCSRLWYLQRSSDARPVRRRSKFSDLVPA